MGFGPTEEGRAIIGLIKAARLDDLIETGGRSPHPRKVHIHACLDEARRDDAAWGARLQILSDLRQQATAVERALPRAA